MDIRMIFACSHTSDSYQLVMAIEPLISTKPGGLRPWDGDEIRNG
jgi:hypothetical protein